MNCEMPMGLRFSIVSRAFKKRTDELLREQDMTGVQLGVLGQLRHLELTGLSEIRQRDLEEAAHMSHPTMTEILKRLERKELVELRPSANDRRCKLIRSTPKAEELHLRLGEVDRNVFEMLCTGLEREQLDALLTALDTMIDNAAKCCGKGCDC